MGASAYRSYYERSSTLLPALRSVGESTYSMGAIACSEWNTILSRSKHYLAVKRHVQNNRRAATIDILSSKTIGTATGIAAYPISIHLNLHHPVAMSMISGTSADTLCISMIFTARGVFRS